MSVSSTVERPKTRTPYALCVVVLILCTVSFLWGKSERIGQSTSSRVKEDAETHTIDVRRIEDIDVAYPDPHNPGRLVSTRFVFDRIGTHSKGASEGEGDVSVTIWYKSANRDHAREHITLIGPSTNK